MRIQRKGAGILSLAEVELFPARNLALGKTVSQSSTAGGGAAALAVDGSRGTGDMARTAATPIAWWQVDLGTLTGVGDVVLYGLRNGFNDLRDVDVLVSTDGQAWTSAASFDHLGRDREEIAIDRTTRFVRIQRHDGEALALAEVEISPSGNLARGKNASQSSTSGGGDAGRVIDGNVDGDWNAGSVSHTNADAHAWWQVDLGHVAQVGQVVLFNRTDCCRERLSAFEVQVSSNGTDWLVAGSYLGAAPVRSDFNVGRLARYVRVRLNGTGYLSLAEVLVLPPEAN